MTGKRDVSPGPSLPAGPVARLGPQAAERSPCAPEEQGFEAGRGNDAAREGPGGTGVGTTGGPLHAG